MIRPGILAQQNVAPADLIGAADPLIYFASNDTALVRSGGASADPGDTVDTILQKQNPASGRFLEVPLGGPMDLTASRALVFTGATNNRLVLNTNVGNGQKWLYAARIKSSVVPSGNSVFMIFGADGSGQRTHQAMRIYQGNFETIAFFQNIRNGAVVHNGGTAVAGQKHTVLAWVDYDSIGVNQRLYMRVDGVETSSSLGTSLIVSNTINNLSFGTRDRTDENDDFEGEVYGAVVFENSAPTSLIPDIETFLNAL